MIHVTPNFFKSDDRLQWTSPPLFSPLHPHNSVLSDQYKYWLEAREKPVDPGVQFQEEVLVDHGGDMYTLRVGVHILAGLSG